jgi:polyhydroxybutyrate depolymerase
LTSVLKERNAMKSLACLLFIVCVIPLIAQTRHDFTMTVDSVERTFIVSRPSGAVPAGGYPVVFMFHGTSGDGERFFNISGWKEKGEQEKFISVFPSSLEYCVIDSGRQYRTTKWNNGDLQSVACPGQYLKDDVHFVRRIIDTMRKSFPIDARRIYASGFSNGGVFTSKLAVEMSDVFAAISASAGPIFSSDSGATARNIPFWLTLGDRDERWVETLGITALPFNDSTLNMARPYLNRYLGCFDLAWQYSTNALPTAITWIFRTPSSSAPVSEFRFSLIKDLTHQYPNGQNVPLVIATPLWQFFSQYSLPVTSVGSLPVPAREQLYPNPAQDRITISGEGPVTVTIRTLLGSVVHRMQTGGGSSISLPRLAPGAYVAEIDRTGRISHTLLRIVR